MWRFTALGRFGIPFAHGQRIHPGIFWLFLSVAWVGAGLGLAALVPIPEQGP